MQKAKLSNEAVQCIEGVIQQISEDLTDKAQLLRELFNLTEMESIGCQISLCNPENCPHRQRLKELLSHTIEELEKTKKAFKSKQLEALRKKLCKDLAEI
jgi:DNA gyrase/topoisomerase IV subunit A